MWVAPLLMTLGLAAHAAPMAEAVPGEYIVKVKSMKAFGESLSAQRSVGAGGISVVLPQQKILKIKRSMLEASDAVISQLKQDPNVEIAEPNYIYHATKTPNDPLFGQLWGMNNSGQNNGRAGLDIGALQAWEIEKGSKNVVVAIIDTGIDYTHEDLKENMWVNQKEYNGKPQVDDDGNGFVDDIYGYNFAGNTGDPMDDFGHGTHCAGTIGAKGDNNIGVAGVNWNVRLMAVKFLDASGSGTLDNALKSIDYATKMGAVIDSNSWGGGGQSETLQAAIQRARDKGILFVAAAGNDGSDNDQSPTYPANYPVDNVVAVAAIDSAGNTVFTHDDGSAWWGTNFGKTTVHVAAPGHLILSTVPKANAEISDPSGYKAISGTSMATPHVSGVAALLKAHEPKLSYLEIKNRLVATAAPLAGLRSKTISGGVVNAYYALLNQKAPADPEDPFSWNATAQSAATPHPYSNGFTQDYTIKVSGAKEIAVFFDRFEFEDGYDFVSIKDGAGNLIAKLTGNHNGEFAPNVKGDTVVLSVTTDSQVNNYGFDVTKAAIR
jgi:subtilisin family serine protease